MRFLTCLVAAYVAAGSLAYAAPPLEAYGKLPAIDLVSLSPSGTRFALVARDGEARKIFVRRADGQAELVAPMGAAKVRSLEWAGDDHLLTTISATVGSPISGLVRQEWSAIYHFGIPQGPNYGVFQKSKTYIDAVFGWYGSAKVGGKWYAYVGGISYEKVRTRSSQGAIQPDLYRIDLETREVDLLDTAGAGRRRWVVGADGAVVGHSAYDARGLTYSLHNGTSRDAFLTRRAGEGEFVLVGLGRTPGSLLVGQRGAETQVAREFRPGGPADGEVLLADASDSEALFDRETRLLIGMTSPLGATLFDPAHQRRVDAARKAFPNERTVLVDYDKTFDRMVMLTDGPKDSGTYWLVDIARKSATPIGYVRPEVKTADVGPMRVVSYKAGDGLAMDGILTLPPGREAKGLPLVVLPHGGPLVPGDKAGFDWWAQAFASRGYAVFQPNYRGTVGYGEPFRRAAYGQFGRKMQTDISDGVAALAAQGIVDPRRACIVGASYGGYAALAGVTVQQGLYRCAASVAGPTDMSKFIIWVRTRTGMDQRSVRFWKELSGASEGQDLDEISPVRLAARADAPILLIHGRDDTVVPLEQSLLMEKALKQAGKSVELVNMAGEDHWLSGEPTRQLMLARTIAFVEQHNPAQ
ncbi:prolyl oligopeptidase family serine peptidase [Phenylobacterium sp.]|uniref:alpha/beta hydrolase family protein n=1 Tax=Phenylobacterium sp. TaxID=1871053 RepID=UPI0030F4AE47